MNKYFFVLIFLISCSTPKNKTELGDNYQPRRSEFLGYWIGEMPTKDGKFLRWLIERRVDGAFTLTHVIKDSPQDPRKFDPEKAKFELGTWGISGDVYFTATRQYYEGKKISNFDTSDPGLYDAYKIVSFDGKNFVYRSLETGEEFMVKKVPQGDKLEL